MPNKAELSIINAIEKFAIKLHANSEWVIYKLREYKFLSVFTERDDDIYVVTYMKSGTTWMQMILYLMLHGNHDDFEHIYDVSPWLSNAAYLGNTPDAINALPSPRILKTHNSYNDFRKNAKGRFIYVMRNGMDVAASIYHHDRNYKNPAQTFDETFNQYFLDNKKDNWFSFNQSWLNNNNRQKILYVAYEDLKHNLDAALNAIARFLEIELTPQKLELIKRYSSFEYMKSIEHKFGERPNKETVRVYNQFIRKGESNYGHTYLNPQQQNIYRDKYRKTLSALVGARFNAVTAEKIGK